MKTIARFEKVSRDILEKVINTSVDDPIGDVYFDAVYSELKLPKRATVGSAGYDFFAPQTINLFPQCSTIVPTGIRCHIENGYVLEIYPRSGLGFKHRISLNNTVGIIDSDYYYSDNEGHIMIRLYNPTDDVIVIPIGDAFAQGIFKEFFLAEEEEVTATRNGGFGSTTKK